MQLRYRVVFHASNLPNNETLQCNFCKRCPWRKLAVSPDCCLRRRRHSCWNLDPVSAWDVVELPPTVTSLVIFFYQNASCISGLVLITEQQSIDGLFIADGNGMQTNDNRSVRLSEELELPKWYFSSVCNNKTPIIYLPTFRWQGTSNVAKDSATYALIIIVIMAALWNRAGHYILPCGSFLSSTSSSSSFFPA